MSVDMSRSSVPFWTRRKIIWASLFFVIGSGLLIRQFGQSLPLWRGLFDVPPAVTPSDYAQHAQQQQLARYFQRAVTMLHAKEYDYAITALHEVLMLEPKMPEAHANMGYALLGKEQYRAAADFFNTAIELNSRQYNAYYGLALAMAGQNNLIAALGAMESFLHLTDKNDPFVSKAKSWIAQWRVASGADGGQSRAVPADPVESKAKH